MNRQAVLDVLNSLEVIEMEGGDSPYCLVAYNDENRSKLNAVGVSDEVMLKYGDVETFCIWALAFSEGYADEWKDGNLVLWGPIDDELRTRVVNGDGTPADAERLLEELARYKFVREPVLWFAGMMESKLQENDHKGGWDNCTFQYLFQKLDEEVKELTTCISEEKAIQEAADVANIAMMIADRARKALSQR